MIGQAISERSGGASKDRNARSKPRNRRRNNNNNVGEHVMQPLAQPAVIRNQNTKVLRESGSDFIDSVEISDNVALGSEIFSVEVTPSMTERLHLSTSRFQRIRWLNMRFKLSPGMSASSAGEYAVAFIRDPSDNPALSDPRARVQWLCGQKHSTIAKWWQPSTINVPITPDLLYTSASDDSRLYSPGRLVVYCAGSPFQKGSMSIWFDWNVQLSEPSIETEPEEEVKQVVLPYSLQVNKYPYNECYLGLVRYRQQIDTFSPTVHNDNWDPINMAEIGFDSYPDGTIFKCNVPMVFSGQFGATGSLQVTEMVHYWKKGKYALGSTSDKYDTLTPVYVDHLPDGSVSVLEACYVNSTGTGSYTWADIYTQHSPFPQGTIFTVYDPSKPSVPEVKRVLYRGKWISQRTGRFVSEPQTLTPAEVADNVPMVRLPLDNGIPVKVPPGYRLPVSVQDTVVGPVLSLDDNSQPQHQNYISTKDMKDDRSYYVPNVAHLYCTDVDMDPALRIQSGVTTGDFRACTDTVQPPFGLKTSEFGELKYHHVLSQPASDTIRMYAPPVVPQQDGVQLLAEYSENLAAPTTVWSWDNTGVLKSQLVNRGVATPIEVIRAVDDIHNDPTTQTLYGAIANVHPHIEARGDASSSVQGMTGSTVVPDGAHRFDLDVDPHTDV